MRAEAIRRCGAALALLVAGLAGPASAQDEGLDPLLFAPLADRPVQEVDGRSLQIYRIPLSYSVRDAGEDPWGLRITFPVSVSSVRVEAITDIGDFVAHLETISVIPGVELAFPMGERWQLKPFTEVGVGRAESATEVLYAAGVKVLGSYRPGRWALTLGGVAAYKSPTTSRSSYDSYSRIEAGADVERTLGFRISGRTASGGVYGIIRRFSDLDLATIGEEEISLHEQYELGISLTTDPTLSVGKLKLPWIGLGYQFGDVFSGVRLYLSFPF